MVIFILAALISFATGSSWGTMGILMPLVVPLVWNTGLANHLPMTEIHSLIFGSVSSVLAGSVWGDHCSPISDTTILSSSASHCNHIEHVRTQLPYALVVGVVSVFALIAAFVLEIPVWIIYPAGFAVLFGIIHRFGRSPETEGATGLSALEDLDD
jgi:Na+/H+ antiporter NhaC